MIKYDAIVAVAMKSEKPPRNASATNKPTKSNLPMMCAREILVTELDWTAVR